MKQDTQPHTPWPAYKKQLYLGILFLVLAMIATLIVILMPKDKPKVQADETHKFTKQGVAMFYNKDGSEKCRFEIEIADTEEKQKTGLMYRDSMAAIQAMLFTFAKPETQRFWMKNTYLPLDIIYISSDSVIVSIGENTKPFSEETVDSNGLAQYVLEVNAGLSKKLNLQAGDKFSWKKD
jgi:uncharacterized membrane protein (UPF0127 family)